MLKPIGKIAGTLFVDESTGQNVFITPGGSRTVNGADTLRWEPMAFRSVGNNTLRSILSERGGAVSVECDIHLHLPISDVAFLYGTFYKQFNSEDVLESWAGDDRLDPDVNRRIVLAISRKQERMARESAPRTKQANPKCVYLLRDGDTGYVKIGISKNVKLRQFGLASGLPKMGTTIVCYSRMTGSAISKEKELHSRFSKNRIRGEWFYLTDAEIESVKSEILSIDGEGEPVCG